MKKMKAILLAGLLTTAALAMLTPELSLAATHKVCHWDQHHAHQLCHWVH
jgi:hypothetical protein